MPKGKKYGGRDFQPGNPGGPGRPKASLELKGQPRLTRESYSVTLNKIAHKTPEELIQMLSKENRNKYTMLELWIANVVKIGYEKGDMMRLESILNRAIGPVKQQLEVSGSIEQLVAGSHNE